MIEDCRPLLAEQLLLLSVGRELDEHPVPWENLKCAVIGSLVADLVDRGRVVVRFSSDVGDQAIAIGDHRATGDDVLDDALRVLHGDRVATVDTEITRAERLWGWRSRRRLLATGKVTRRDVMRWWEGCWKCAEFDELAPTLLCQLLTLYEQLWNAFERLHARIDVQPQAPDFGIQRAACVAARERLRAVALDEAPPRDACAHYVAAMCGGFWESGWLRDALCDTGDERGALCRRGERLLEDDPLARAVTLVLGRFEALMDWVASAG
ncbi:MAG: GPP34 family phosphoprotein [Actinobacteria bacterium]|nr:GPP34 family phosphoprotein [Actinomycetota bacterium]